MLLASATEPSPEIELLDNALPKTRDSELPPLIGKISPPSGAAKEATTPCGSAVCRFFTDCEPSPAATPKTSKP
jgi:hypothetical protein